MRYSAINIATDLPVAAPPANQPTPEGIKYMYLPRIRCHDCPGKLYTPGPDTTVGNFEVHLKNRLHRERVDARTAAEGQSSNQNQWNGIWIWVNMYNIMIGRLRSSRSWARERRAWIYGFLQTRLRGDANFHSWAHIMAPWLEYFTTFFKADWQDYCEWNLWVLVLTSGHQFP